MSSHNALMEPKLAAPGAGIPWYQTLLLRLYVGPFVSAKTPWEISQARADQVHKKILAEIEGLNEQQLKTRVLVPPQAGLEDSSRYWSVAMALEHVVIVGRSIFELVPALTAGVSPTDRTADTAKVKPFGQMSTQQSIENFKDFMTDEFALLNRSLKDRNSKTTFKHPWFGNMTAQQWYWLISAHAGIHLKQIREIKKQLDYL